VKSKFLCAVQMNWSAEHYRTQSAFEAKIRSAMDAFQVVTGGAGEEALIAFPEDVGTPLVLAHAPAWVFRARTLQRVITRLTACHITGTAAYRAKYKVSWVRALLLDRARIAARIYFETFAKVAKEYRAYIVAGSILLPDFKQQPFGKKADYIPADGNVYNICYLFGPDGRILGSQKKVRLVPGLEDKSGFDISNGSLEDLKVFDTPFGRLGIAICLDGFKEDVVETLAKLGTDILIQPSANCKPWTKAEQEGWMDSIWKDICTQKFSYGLNPMMNGCLFDLCFEGQSSILKKDVADNKNTGYRDIGPSPYFVKVAETHDNQEILVAAMTEE
jgi:hypothetical protein